MNMNASLMIIATAAALRMPDASAQAPEFPMKPPADSAIPAGPKGLAIQEGRKLLTETHQRLPKTVGNGLTCTHFPLARGPRANASPGVGVWGVVP